MRTFTTVHRPKDHRALFDGGELGPFPTEIDLARALLERGVDLKKYAHESRGNEGLCVVQWWLA